MNFLWISTDEKLYVTKKQIEQYYEYTVNKKNLSDVTYRTIDPFPYDTGNDKAVAGLNYTIGGKYSCKGDLGGPLWIRKKIGGKYFGYLVNEDYIILLLFNALYATGWNSIYRNR